jgi:uncharacterized membrane protein
VTLKPAGRAPRDQGRAPRHAARVSVRQPASLAAALAVMALLVLLRRWWGAEVLLVPTLLIVPGLILLRALRVPGQTVSAYPVYVPCASIIVLFGSGLAVDVLGPLVGLATPLRAWPLLVALEGTCLGLLAVSVKVPPDVSIDWRPLSRPARYAWPLVIPLVAAAGALRLNAGHGNSVALIAICAVITLLVTAAAVSSRLDEALLQFMLYAAGLAMTWADSLRGEPLYGFDIATEYQRLQQTVTAGVWHPGHPGDAYGAMLSLTVMPAALHELSGLPALLVFKVVFPMIYALFPVAIFCLGRRLLSRRWAFVAAAFTIGQYAFTEMAGFARQEIALVFFAALIAAMLDTGVSRLSQWALTGLLGVATALSHYSTTYVAVTVIGLSILLQWCGSWFRAIPRVTGAVAVAFVALFAGAAIWYGPVTHSDSHVLEVAQTVKDEGLDFLPTRVAGDNFLAAYLQGNQRTPIPAAHYAQQIHNYYSVNKVYIKPFPDAGQARYALRDFPVPIPPVRWHLVDGALGLGLLVIEQLVNVLAAIGALVMVLRREASVTTRQIGLLALATVLLLTVLRFSGTLAIAYGQERAQLQGLALLAVAVCWTMQTYSAKRRARQTHIPRVAAACLAVILVNTSYLLGAVLGGQVSVNLANSGSAYEYYYMTAPEFASAQWLGGALRPGQLVYADEYGQLPLVAVTGIQQGLFLDLTPLTLNQNAWVYASHTNVIDGRAFALYHDHLATYGFPASFLDTKYDLVYTNGSSEVFHR